MFSGSGIWCGFSYLIVFKKLTPSSLCLNTTMSYTALVFYVFWLEWYSLQCGPALLELPGVYSICFINLRIKRCLIHILENCIPQQFHKPRSGYFGCLHLCRITACCCSYEVTVHMNLSRSQWTEDVKHRTL